jgi:translation initiation factor 4G
MPVVIRAATPDDADFVGWASVMAARSQLARGWFDIVLGRDEAFILEFAKYLALARAVSWWHWSLFRIAEVDGQRAAALCGFADESFYYASREAMAEAAGRTGIAADEQEQFWPRGAFIVKAATSEDGAWTIENVATRAEFRGTGVTLALLQRELQQARSAGFRRAQISLYIGNARAERAYSKAGFVFVEQKHAPEFQAALGIPGTRRLARDL